MTKVAICTVNWNGKKDTLDLLASLKKLDTSGLLVKIFLVSNQKELFFKKNSSSKRGVPFELIYKKQNRGSAGGYNDGARAAIKWGADYILFLGNDTLIKNSSLVKDLVATAKSDPKIGLVSPKMYFAPGFEFYKKRYSKQDLGNVIWYAGGTFDWANVMSSHRGIDEIDTGKYEQVEETELNNTTCIFVSTEVFKKSIFLDEKLFAYFDDNDWSERVTRAGFKRYYDGRVAIYHKVSRTAGIGSPISDYYLTRNRLIFGMRYATIRTKISLFREALRLLFSGRPMQKKGVIDFFLGKRGELDNQII